MEHSAKDGQRKAEEATREAEFIKEHAPRVVEDYKKSSSFNDKIIESGVVSYQVGFNNGVKEVLQLHMGWTSRAFNCMRLKKNSHFKPKPRGPQHNQKRPHLRLTWKSLGNWKKVPSWLL